MGYKLDICLINRFFFFIGYVVFFVFRDVYVIELGLMKFEMNDVYYFLFWFIKIFIGKCFFIYLLNGKDCKGLDEGRFIK